MNRTKVSIAELNKMLVGIEADPATMSAANLAVSSGRRNSSPAVQQRIKAGVLRSRVKAGASIRKRWQDPAYRALRSQRMKNNNTKYPTPEEVVRYRKALKWVGDGMPVKHAADRASVKYERLRLYLRGERLDDLK